MIRNLAAAVIALLAVAPRDARGQICHEPVVELPETSAPHDHAHHHGHSPAAAPAHRVTATVRGEGALIEDGSWQGLRASLDWSWRRWGAGVHLPAYRLDRGMSVTGLGDVIVELRAHLLHGDTFHAGAALAVSVPTGSADDGLGMGHPMAMPTLWSAVVRGRASLTVIASAGQALGSDPHLHHRQAIVDPMNPTELGGGARAAFAVTRSLRLDAGGAVATPFGDGVTRAVAGTGARWRGGAWTTSLALDLGLVGNPFTVRMSVQLAREL